MESGLVPSTHARPLESRLAPTPTLASSESLTNPFAYHPFALVTKRAGGVVGPFPRLGFRMVWMTTRFYVSQVANVHARRLDFDKAERWGCQPPHLCSAIT